MTDRLGIYGGTFGPPHLGHVRAAKVFLAHMNPPGIAKEDEFRLTIMPAALPPHKQDSAADSPEVRLAMCRAAFRGIEGAEVSDYEIQKGGISYTVHTLEHFTRPGRKLWLLCGSDMFVTLDGWYRAQDIFRLAHIACISRGGEERRVLAEKKAAYEEKFGALILLLEGEPFPLSSTEIREKIARGEGLEGLVPAEVAAIIQKKRLYERGFHANE